MTNKLAFDERKRLTDLFRLLEDEVARLENSFTFAANKRALLIGGELWRLYLNLNNE